MESLSGAFNTLLFLHYRSVTIERLERDGSTTGPFPIKISPSNYSRNLAGPEETSIHGREFVVSKQILDAVEWGTPKKGDRLIDIEMGDIIISEVREMFIFGKISGYRIRTS